MSEAQQSYNHPQYVEEDELSLIDLWNILWKRKWIILTLGPLFGIVGIVIALTSQEIYRSETLLAPASEDKGGGGLSALAGQFGGLASLAGINMGGGGNTETAIATLKSRRFLIPFIHENNLLPVLFPENYDPASKTWISEDGTPPSDWKVFKRFKGSVLNVSQDKKTGLVSLSIELPDPALSEQLVNQLPTKINTHLREEAKHETEKNLAYLKSQLAETQVLEIRESLYSLIESESKNAMLANAKEEYAFKVIDPGVVPEERIKPKRSLIVIAAGMLGGFLGIFLCFVLHFVETAKNSTKAAED